MKLGTGSLIVALVIFWVALSVQAISSPSPAEPARSVVLSEPLHLNNTTQAPRSAVPFWNNSSVWEGYTFGFPPASSPWGSFGLTYAFGGQIQLTGGAVDAGTNRTGRVTVETPSYSELNITVASQSVSVPLPNPLGVNQSFSVASLDLQLDVPYLGSITLADFSLAIVASVEIEGDSTVAGCGTGAGNPIWDGSGGFGFTACAKNLTVGSSFVSTLSNISLALAVGVQAVATITPWYTDVINILPMTPLVSFPAPNTAVKSAFNVVRPLSNLSAAVTPNPTVYGADVSLISNVSGGAGNVSYSYAGVLPGDGCGSVGEGELTCTAENNGNFTVEVIATDQEGASLAKLVRYTASPPQTVRDSTWSPPSWNAVEGYLLTVGEAIAWGGLTILGLVIGVALLRRFSDVRGENGSRYETPPLVPATTHSEEDGADTALAGQSDSDNSWETVVIEHLEERSTRFRRVQPRDPATGRFVSTSKRQRNHPTTSERRRPSRMSGK